MVRRMKMRNSHPRYHRLTASLPSTTSLPSAPWSKPLRRGFTSVRVYFIPVIALLIYLIVSPAFSPASVQPASPHEESSIPGSNSLKREPQDTIDLDVQLQKQQHKSDVVMETDARGDAQSESTLQVEKSDDVVEVKPQAEKIKENITDKTHQAVRVEPVSLAFAIEISAESLYTIDRLLKSLHHPDNFYLLHFDPTVDKGLAARKIEDIQSVTAYKRNVQIIPAQLVSAGGVSSVLHILSMINRMLSENNSWQYFINLSAADYPMLHPDALRRVLGEYKDKNFMSLTNKELWNGYAGKSMTDIWYDEVLSFRKEAKRDGVLRLEVGNPLGGDIKFVVAAASKRMMLSRNFCEYLIGGDEPRKMLVSFAYAAEGAKYFYASAAMREEKYRKNLISSSLWIEEGKDGMEGLFGEGLGKKGRELLEETDARGRKKETEENIRKQIQRLIQEGGE